ncbi:MAG: SLC13 family permease [Alphaproteobacteria bacterium]|nr:SLC13 family permease [Alphaproteobacteria bacterium]
MDFFANPAVHMWFMLVLTGAAVFSFIKEKLSMEVTSIVLVTVLLLYGQFFPIFDEMGENQLNAQSILSGFSNSSLIAVLALLVMGQGMIHTDSLRFLTSLFVFKENKFAWLSIILILVFVMVLSAFMNNTPLVIIAIPVIQTVLHTINTPASRVMMPLSFVAILGGMTTLVGSSTNLLVSSTMVELGHDPFEFFDLTVPGIIMASIGFIYVLLVLPRILPHRASIKEELVGDKTEFVAELDIAEDSKLVGDIAEDGSFPSLKGVSVKLIQRKGQLVLPPFSNHTIQSGDILIITATRHILAGLLNKYPGYLLSDEEAELIHGSGVNNINDEINSTDSSILESVETRVLAKVMITPASNIIDMSIDNTGFHKRFGVIVLGIQRRAKVVRRRLGRVRLEAGDVLLVVGPHSRINNLRQNSDFIVLSGSKKDLPVPNKAPLALSIFLVTIASAATGFLSIPVAAFSGAVTMIGTRCLNIRQATRAIDRRIFLLVGSMLALGLALQVTGGAEFIANLILSAPHGNSPLFVAALLFLIVALATNILTNNACAILFTPIALNIASEMEAIESITFDLSYIFVLSVVFGANCSFASPIGYQTNLLIMGPGQYKFRDFIKAGTPLVLIIWITYIFIAKYYFGLS